VVNRRKPHVQTSVVSRYPALAPIDEFVLLFFPPCGPHLTLESALLASPLLGDPTRHRPFVPTLHLHQRKSSLNLHLQYLAKSQSTPRSQSLITARSDHPPVLSLRGGCRRPASVGRLHPCVTACGAAPERRWGSALTRPCLGMPGVCGAAVASGPCPWRHRQQGHARDRTSSVVVVGLCVCACSV
jgi:hypothetical protein